MSVDLQEKVVLKEDTPSRYSHMTPAQKWAEAVKLREMEWALKRRLKKKTHPDWSDEQVKKDVRGIFLYATT